MLRKFRIFPRNSPKKLCFRVVVDAFRVVDRVGTNSFRCESLTTGRKELLSGDVLIKLRHHTEESARQLCLRMEEAQMRNEARVDRPRTRASARAEEGAEAGGSVSAVSRHSLSSHRSISSLSFISSLASRRVRSLIYVGESASGGDEEGIDVLEL